MTMMSTPDYHAALEKRREHLEKVGGMWPERLKRQPPTVTAGDLHRARLPVGAPDPHPGYQPFATGMTERWEDRKLRRPRRREARGHYNVTKPDGRSEQSPEQRARRAAAWTPEKRAAAAARATCGAAKMDDPRHTKRRGPKRGRC